MPKRPFHRKTPNIPIQHLHIRSKFPSFQLMKRAKGSYWVGYLQPTAKSPKYKIKIIYHPYHPEVFVLEPTPLRSAPHRYPDGSLCLYYPKDKDYDAKSLIADKIIPWTSEWLFFYEAWLEQGIWWGKEAPHHP